jgi:hypothetical protein
MPHALSAQTLMKLDFQQLCATATAADLLCSLHGNNILAQIFATKAFEAQTEKSVSCQIVG